MSEDYETKRTDQHPPAKDPGDERPAVEDPLVELARIVHKNKQSGANVSSGRVGSTDYFAELDGFAEGKQDVSADTPARVEPTFSSQEPVSEEQQPGYEPEEPAAPVASFEPLQHSETPLGSDPEPAVDFTNMNTNVSPLWPKGPTPQAKQEDVTPAVQPPSQPEFSSPAQNYQVNPGMTGVPGLAASNDQTKLAPSVALDLEQNLTAELEEELIGVLRQTVDEEPEAVIQKPVAFVRPVEDIAEEPMQGGPTPQSGFDEPVLEKRVDPNVISVGEEDQISLSAVPTVSVPQPDPVVPGIEQLGTHAFNVNVAPSIEVVPAPGPVQSGVSAPSVEVSPSQDTVSPIDLDSDPFAEPQTSTEAAKPAPESKRPAIDESDFFAALNPEKNLFAGSEDGQQDAQSQEKSKLTGIDALFADLEFPDPVERKPAEIDDQAEPSEKQVSAAEIDDMTWPAAADAVPQSDEDETPPPPEGYDLDAVARAMQESDPSLTGSGVLPPHPSAEEAAVPQAKEKSRRGLFVAAGVLGVAVLGGAGFFMIDGEAVQVPSGPPPVVSGLQEPLKVYPEQEQAQANDAASKLIYDRVDETSGTGPARLILPESPQPAELPPAPAGSNGSAELVPGSPKRVTTYKVLPDGTIVSESEAAAQTAGTPPVSAPVSAAEDTSRVVSTTPLVPSEITPPVTTPAPEPAIETPVETAAATPETPPVPATAVPIDTPAIVAEAPETPSNETAVNEAAGTEPAAPVPTVLPRKKPVAPVQVASAPVSQTNPAPTTQNDGPLNLSQTASAPAPAATDAGQTSTGSIPSGTYIVQVTSQRSAAAASDAYAGLQRRFPSILGSRNAVVVSADLGDRGVFYRARIPTGSRDEANSLCSSLQGAGGDCFVRRQP